MRKIWKKVLAFMLAMVLSITAFHIPVYAQENITNVPVEATEETEAGIETEVETETPKEETESPGWDGVTKEAVFEADNYIVTFQLESSWDNGYNANIKLENTGKETIQNWHLGFDYNQTITNIWNAEISANAGNEHIVKNAGWNQDIAAGGSVEFGISGDHAFQGFPKNYKLKGTIAEVGKKDYTIAYHAGNDWGSGFTGSISITNNTDKPLEDWVLEFDFGREITQIVV